MIKPLLIIVTILFVFYQSFHGLHDVLKKDYFVYCHVEESYMKVKQIRVKFPLAGSGNKSRKIEGRLTGNACDYFGIGYDLKDSIAAEVRLPHLRNIDDDKISYDAKYDTLFPFLNHGTIVKGKKNRKGLATTSYVVACDSIIPIWRPKDAENASLDQWKFRYAQDEKSNWYKKWTQNLVISIICLILLYFLWKKSKK